MSVIIPVYNTAQYLRECLESVLAQTHRNLEIICIDDGSTDDSAALLEEIAATDERLRIIRREHEGVGATRNAGIDAATGELLTFVDSDDLVEPELVETMVHALGGTDTVLPGWPGARRLAAGPEVIAPGIRLGTLNTHGKILRAALIRSHAIRFEEDLPLREDIIFNAAYLLHAKTVTLVPEQFYRHRPRPGSLTSAFRPDKVRELATANARLEALTQPLKSPEFSSLFNYLQIRSLISAGLNLHHPNSTIPRDEASRLLRTWQRETGRLPVSHGDLQMRLVGLLFRVLGLTGTVSLIHRLKQLRARLPR